MDSNIYLVVEGIADKKFISDLVSFHFGKSLEKENFQIASYGPNWVKNNASVINLAIAKDFVPILVLDANGNHASRKTEITNGIGAEKLTCPFFLLPDNHSNGNLETLLLSLTIPAHSSVLSCFDDYYNCLGAYEKPDSKVKVYSYIAAIQGPEMASESKRDYKNLNVWDLNHPNLQALINFLGPLV